MKFSLTDTATKNAKPQSKPYKLADGGGLYLYVSPKGAKTWRYKYRLAGKEQTFTIGAYPAYTLASARTEHAKARQLVGQGTHPIHHRRTEKLKQSEDAINTFRAVTLAWIGVNRAKWSPYYLRQVERCMATDVFPQIGSMPIKQVTAAHILAILKGTEARGAETVAINIRMWCSAVFRYAIGHLKAENDPAAALKGTIVRPTVKHSTALPPKEVALLVDALRKFGGYRSTKIAIELLLLTFVRTAELRKAQWDEFDLDGGIWRIPAHRMKMKREHVVPLSTQAVALLLELKEYTGNRKCLFPNYRNPNDCMTATTINRALERMGYGGKFSAHGFRSTASTILYEKNQFNPDAIERQLAHGERNKVKAAYNHAQHLPERAKMMQWWGDFVMTVSKGATIHSIKVAA